MGKLFDNVMKKLRVVSTYLAGTLVSLEMDFDIPRGYIVKIHDVVLEVKGIERDLLAIDVDAEWRYQVCLVKDPDDVTSMIEPNNVIDHDVLMTHEVGVHNNPVATVGNTLIIGSPKSEANYTSEGLDVFSARNMRMNIDVVGADLANATEATGECVVSYTLERIMDSEIINILDIL